jgi:hypothetical protein
MMNENLLSPLMLMHHTEFIKTSNLNQQLPQHLGSGAVVAASHKQKIVTKSAESELVAASDAGGMSLGLRNYLISRDHDVEPAVLGQDNEASESIIVNGPFSSKRTNSRYFHLTDYVRQTS